MRTTREMFAHVKSLGSRACGRVLCSPNHTFVSHPMISEHWDERSRRNLEASAPIKARSEPTDRASERLRCPLCVRRTFVFHVPELACTLSAASGVMRGDASYSRRERPFAIILGVWISPSHALHVACIACAVRCRHGAHVNSRDLQRSAFSSGNAENRTPNRPMCTKMLGRRLVFIAHTTYTLP